MADFEVFREFNPEVTTLYGGAESVIGKAVVVTTIGQLYDLDFEEDQIPIVLTEQGAHTHQEKYGIPPVLNFARGLLTFGRPTAAENTHYQTVLRERGNEPGFLAVDVFTFVKDDNGSRFGLDHWEMQDFSRPFVGLTGKQIELRRKGLGAEILIRS